MSEPSEKTIYSIGHSTHGIEIFLSLLARHGIQLLADVRTVPKSRANPQFNSDSLAEAVRGAGMEYRHFRGLGGWRGSKLPESPNAGWRSPGFRNYADYMMTGEFDTALEELIAAASRAPTAIMCAEVLPWRCHRNLISDALTVRGFRVMHIIGESGFHQHALTPWANVSGTHITYPPQKQ